MSACVLFFSGCASFHPQTTVYHQIIRDLQQERYKNAALTVERLKQNQYYQKKDRVLFYLDQGMIHHYDGRYEKSNRFFDQAEIAMEELFTKSISQAGVSFMLNDNVLDYRGETYEHLYVNLFKAINFLQLNRFDHAYVEINRVNDKLKTLEDQYGRLVDALNRSDSAKVKFKKEASAFYDDALAHYLSHLIFLADDEYDNSRISYEKTKSAWLSQPNVYASTLPEFLKKGMKRKTDLLTVIAFVGTGPYKKSIGGQITTYKNLIHYSDPSYQKNHVVLPFPGIKQGYHFKFAFPEIESGPSLIKRIDVYIDNRRAGSLDLFEDLSQVAEQSFMTNKKIIYLKTVVRTVLKGAASAKAKQKLREKAGAQNSMLFGAVLNFGVDMLVDETEQPDLRCWQTLPKQCYAGEFKVPPGKHTIRIRFIGKNNELIKEKTFADYSVKQGLNLLEAVCLN